MNSGILFGIIGTVLGLMGGFIGTYHSYKNAKNLPEKRFVLIASFVFLSFTSLFLVLLFSLPQFRKELFCVYPFLLWGCIVLMNQKQNAIRNQHKTKV